MCTHSPTPPKPFRLLAAGFPQLGSSSSLGLAGGPCPEPWGAGILSSASVTAHVSAIDLLFAFSPLEHSRHCSIVPCSPTPGHPTLFPRRLSLPAF